MKNQYNPLSGNFDLVGMTTADKSSVQQTAFSYAADAGATDDYAITLTPAPAAYTAGMVVWFKANTSNTGASTLNLNGLGPKAIKKFTSATPGADLADNDIRAGQLVIVEYDGTNFQMLSALGNAAGTGTVTSVGWTGGIVSVANPTTTPAFTIAGTSGGVPYFSGAATWASSGALTAAAHVFGGGAGAAPSTITYPDIQAFTGSGTWTAPTSFTPQFVKVIAYGGGGGGGGGEGRTAVSAAQRAGGGGGGGGAHIEHTFLASECGVSQTVTIGAAGTLGGGGTNAGGSNGVAGGNTTFGSLLTAYGGGLGPGGSGTTSTGGGGAGSAAAGTAGQAASANIASAGPWLGTQSQPATLNAAVVNGGAGAGTSNAIGGSSAEWGGASGGSGGQSGGAGFAGGSSVYGGAGGGGGGGVTAANPGTASSGAAGGTQGWSASAGPGGGGSAGTSGGAGGLGGAGNTHNGGQGGGGGASSNSTTGGAGNTGGTPGGGGGGGGGGTNVGGAGGAGAPGKMWVISW